MTKIESCFKKECKNKKSGILLFLGKDGFYSKGSLNNREGWFFEFLKIRIIVEENKIASAKDPAIPMVCNADCKNKLDSPLIAYSIVW